MLFDLKELKRLGHPGCHLVLQKTATVFQVADEVKMIKPQGRLWQCQRMAFGQAFAAIDDSGVRRVAALLQIKQMNRPAFMVAIIGFDQQRTKARFNINNTQDWSIAVEQFICRTIANWT